MSNYKTIIEQKTTELRDNNLDLTSILSTINELPEAGSSGPTLDTCTVALSLGLIFTDLKYSVVKCTRVINGEIVPASVSIDSIAGNISEVLCGSIMFIQLNTDASGWWPTVSNGELLEDDMEALKAYLVVRASINPDSIINIVVTSSSGGGTGSGGAD